MGRIGNIVREAHGVPVKDSTDQRTEEHKQAEKEYLDKIRQPKKKVQTKITADQLYQMVMKNIKQKIEGAGMTYRSVKTQEVLVYTLCLYFCKDDRFLSAKIKNKPSFSKGIMIAGNCGTGKTIAMKSFVDVLRNFKDMAIGLTSSLKIVDDYELEGAAGIERYKRNRLYIDDIGSEEVGNNFGKKNVVKNILETRYNLFLDNRITTHVTTNLNPDELREMYGDRLESRLFEMFNIIYLQGKDQRKM